jgi:putative FmdB family regulatory protein
MPTYEYACQKCGHRFEKFQPIAAKALTTCLKDDCGQKKWGRGKVKRLIGAGAGLLFKGSGFYITDHRSEGYKQSAKKDSGSSGGETKAATTESKAAPAKTETPKTKAASTKK